MHKICRYICLSYCTSCPSSLYKESYYIALAHILTKAEMPWNAQQPSINSDVAPVWNERSEEEKTYPFRFKPSSQAHKQKEISIQQTGDEFLFIFLPKPSVV